ncbi:hypothetical protein Pyn_04869 [Prunus yedoensis var. nudiflora]|uniref:Uncharacterized protein n=1 Tax=Prunus yedoensis var. nudiflora TaxID=2094558 RepID=A0A314UV83_PRUYE|nr:hypothetical protein Pyn_04869 [Prunus yedoensis var. nudiflora]
MNHLNRVWMAASVAVVQGPADQGPKWTSGLKSFQLTRRRCLGGAGDASDLRPLSGAVGSGFSQVCEERRNQADESIQKVMYLNCWGQS